MTTEKAAPDRRRRLVVVLVVLAAILLAAAAWVGARALMAKAELEAALPTVESLRSAALEGDVARVEALIPDLAAHAASAASLTGDAVWRGAEVIPVLGSNLSAVRVVSAELDRVSAALPILIDSFHTIAAGDSSSLVDIVSLSASAGPLRSAADSLSTAEEQLAALDTSGLFGPVEDGVHKMRDATSILAPAVAAAADIARTLPPTLGAEGERTVLVMLQNTAELRTGGGITGTFAEIRAENGRVTLVRHADSTSFAARTEAVAPLPDSTTALYSDVVGRFVQNASMSSDFATTAQLASAWWEDLTGRTPDTVVSVDPFVLQALVSVVGPVELAGEVTLDADNLIDDLLVNPYRTLDSQQQSALFASAIESVFGSIANGGLDPLALVQALAGPVSEGRISVWSAHPDEDDVFRAGALGGPAARQDLAGPGAFAVYFNDATGAKLAAYLDVDLSATVVGCRDDGMAEVAVTVIVGSTAPPDVGSWPISMTGGGLFGVGAGDIGTNIAVSAPHGAFLGGVLVKGEPYAAATATDGGHPSASARVNLSPGEVNTLEYRFIVPASDADTLELLHTPLMAEPSVEVESGCA